MNNNKRSWSYPERLADMKERDFIKTHNELILNLETIQKFKEKDHVRTETMADLGSPSSKEPIQKLECCDTVGGLCIRWFNYLLERGENERKEDQIIRQKSYAGFYYFLKWFIRSVFIMVFTTLGSISGKEIGCEIVDHDTCELTAINLAGNSPHIVSTILGFIFGLLVGQWFGRLFWDSVTKNVLRCLRHLEKKADRSKLCLIFTAIIVYTFGTALVGTIFFFFVHIGDNNIIGGCVGGSIGFFCAVIAYRKNSSCRSGQHTPMISPRYISDDIPPLQI